MSVTGQLELSFSDDSWIPLQTYIGTSRLDICFSLHSTQEKPRNITS